MTRISNRYGAVNLSQGFPDFDPPKALLDRLAGQPEEREQDGRDIPGGVHLVFVSHHGEDAPLCVNREARMERGRLVVLR